jgi:hypothetical protein
MEMMLVVLLTGIVMTAATRIYSRISRGGQAVVEATREVRQATALVDRIAREIEGSVLVTRPEGVDPLAHPWLFLGESRRGGLGAERLKFATRSHRVVPEDAAASDLAVVAYWLAPSEGDSFDLLRWTSPHLPESLDRDFPRRDDDGVQVFAEGVSDFGFRFQDDAGNWEEDWDSSTLSRSNQLPIAVDVRVTLEDPDRADSEEAAVFERRVRIALRPLDLEEALASADGASDGEEEDEDGETDDEEETACVTVGQCIAENQDRYDQYVASPLGAGVARAVAPIRDQCFSDYAGLLPFPVQGCE